ncbi:hypothetical protein M5E87_12310 [Flavonifractor plautii]|nr:hypothetical protein M5E87_12310 [Flavonifractor plautii]
MQTLHISRQELHTRGGVLDRMLDSLFDTAILVDTDCRILYISASSFPDPSQRAAVVGQHISVLDQLSPFEEVLRTGQPRPDLFLELHGPCISSLFPVLDGERVIGVVGTITVRNLGRLKRCSPSSATRPPASGASTRIWPGWTAATAWRIL